MARGDPQINFRIPASLKARLEQEAFRWGRTLTAEIVHRLEGSFVEKPEISGQDLAENFRELTERLDKMEKHTRDKIVMMRVLIESAVLDGGKFDEQAMRIATRLITDKD